MYVNYMQSVEEEGEVRVREAYGANYLRLAKVKAKYDPENLFCMNQTIRHSVPFERGGQRCHEKTQSRITGAAATSTR